MPLPPSQPHATGDDKNAIYTIHPVPAVVNDLPGPDAGLRSLDHYKHRLPSWRYLLRQKCLPLVRWETPYLAWAQQNARSSALDSYFAITANLGTHTFFLIFLPILFWCGSTTLGRGMVHVLASGVFISGFIKDLLCLPRPLSPPLQRITMSGTAALEYGFPSTHSTNAVSVAVYMLFMLHSPATNLNETARTVLKVASYCYASSIILGRLYCGMHGFADVIVGGALGAFLSTVQCVYGEMLDNLLYSGSSLTPLLIILFICFLVRIHPEPVDDCPCFDDSVAFAGVMIGVELGNWHYSTSGWAWNDPVPATVPYSLETLGWMKSIARVIFGVLTILAWREMMKPTLLRGLPPLFRVIERLGLNLPRRFFVLASEYEKVPTHLKDDNVVPSVSEFPSLITSMRHPRRRAISIGPQSAADVYETLAHRDKTRRESGGGGGGSSGVSWPKRDASTHASAETRSAEDMHSASPAALSRVHSREKYTTAQDGVLYTPISEAADPMDALHAAQEVASERRKEAQADREMFSNLEKPRVRYDVEVVTKLIVYTGIALLAVEINPMLFETVGLGMS